MEQPKRSFDVDLGFLQEIPVMIINFLVLEPYDLLVYKYKTTDHDQSIKRQSVAISILIYLFLITGSLLITAVPLLAHIYHLIRTH